MAKKFKKWWQAYALLGVSLINGAVIMIFELIGSRIIAPYLGSSSFVWTSIIGVILLALSVGYYYGGRLADKGASRTRLAQILFIAAVFIVLSRIMRDDFLSVISTVDVDVRFKSFFAALVLFYPASLVMGMVSPYVAKLQLQDMKSAGTTIGSIYAAGTAGSIIGTFLYGYWLVGVFPNGVVHGALAVILICLSVAVSFDRKFGRQAKASVAVLVLAIFASMAQLQDSRLLLDTDTQYSRVLVRNTTLDDRPARLYFTEAGRSQSGVYLDGDHSSAFSYAQILENQIKTIPHGRILMIGGGTFTLASDLARMEGDMQIDVVEIDPALTDIAKKYFYYEQTPKITIHNQDGREFLNTTDRKYDVIIIDAYTVNGPPFQLATKQAVEHMRDRLSPNGVIAVNIIASFEGANSQLLHAVYNTYNTVFESISLVPASRGTFPSEQLQNILLYASSNEVKTTPNKREFTPDTTIPVLTDDFAPIEYYTAQATQ